MHLSFTLRAAAIEAGTEPRTQACAGKQVLAGIDSNFASPLATSLHIFILVFKFFN